MTLNRRHSCFPWLLPAVLLLLAGPAPAWAVPQGDYAHPQVLIQADELKDLIDKQDQHFRLLDVRHQAKYYLGHIPGAIQLWRPETEDRRQPVPLLPPPAHHLEKLLGRLGVGSQHTLILYSDQCDHTRLWWLLAHYGWPPDRMRLLDGGMEAWKAKGYPTQLTAPHYKPAVFRFPAPPRKNYLLASLGEVEVALAAPDKVILDVRPRRLFLGELTREGAARPGRIPGALGLFWEENRVASGPYKGYWKSAAELQELYTSRGVTPDKDIYIYGHTSLSAGFTLVSLYLAGYHLDKLWVYGGGWSDWSRSQEPAATGPPK